MLPTTHLLAFVITSFVLIAVPGPSVLFTISRALALGRVAGVATVAGNTVGAYLQVTAVAFGIGPLVARSVAIFTIIKLAGAAYLVFLGVQAIRHRRSLAAVLEGGIEKKTVRRMVFDGFTVGVGNPKVIVFFAAMLPQFVDRRAGDVPVQLLLLGAIFAGIALVSDSVWAVAAGSVRGWFSRSPRRLELVGGTGGLVMIGLGARVALTGRKDLAPWVKHCGADSHHDPFGIKSSGPGLFHRTDTGDCPAAPERCQGGEREEGGVVVHQAEHHAG
jgi:threonine/homoserine/homoserine lactone efflux protein